MTGIVVPCPPTLVKYREHLREFFSGMMHKLHVNSHKNTPDRQHIPDIITLLRSELEEFEDQYQSDKTDANVMVELQDVSNFAFLAFVALRNNGVKTNKERFIDEFLKIDVKSGRVFSKKSRPGSQYKVGEEIKGSRTSGYVIIKLQRLNRNATSITLPRSHLVWWKATGSWPVGVIDHKNRKKDDDRISNLRDVSMAENGLNKSKKGKYPHYVTPYLPTGRNHLKHYGKFVYQRHYKGTNVRFAYFDTPKQAAEIGEKRWNKFVSEQERKDR